MSDAAFIKEATEALLVEILDDDCDDLQSVRAIARTLRAALSAPSPLPAPVEPTDAQVLDWLEHQVVEVRTPVRYGSLASFFASPTSDEDAEAPSDLRAQVRAALNLMSEPDRPPIDWTKFHQWSKQTIGCECGAVYRSHFVLKNHNGRLRGFTEDPCPSCGKDADHARRVSSDVEVVTIGGKPLV